MSNFSEFGGNLDEFFKRENAVRLSNWLVAYASYHAEGHGANTHNFMRQFIEELTTQSLDNFIADPERFIEDLSTE
jgi:hypothetical protein